MSSHKSTKTGLLALTIAAVGVVFGDIGTSPLYAISQIFFGEHPIAQTRTSILGAISLALWALTIIVSFKYIFYVLRADNDGQGGVFALLTLLRNKRTAKILTGGLLILSAGLLFGDGLITPSISVLSAVEGLKVAAPALGRFIVPITCIILAGLFSVQYLGASKIGKFFGPVVSVWFIVLAALGLNQVLAHPTILAAVNPVYAIEFLQQVGFAPALLVLGSVMLVITGGEALYADMGHFGKRPIRLGWFSLVYPALILNYLGQGAYLLSGAPVREGNIFFSTVPSALLIPMIILATMATIIASQALISGVFSLTTQGISLGLFPRLRVLHTHEDHEGQVYVPFINWALFLGCIILVLGFETSTNLASAYGLAVAGDMLVTSLAMILVTRLCWNWPIAKSLLIFVPLLAIDALFLTANSMKLLSGGYVPLGIGFTMFTVMKSWQWGRTKVTAAYEETAKMTVDELVAMNHRSPERFPRSVMILTPKFHAESTEKISGVMQLLLDHYGAMPKHVIMLTIASAKVPYIDPKDRYEVKVFDNDAKFGTIAAIRARFGFMELPDIKEVAAYVNQYPEIVAHEDMKNWLVFAGHEQLAAHTTHLLEKLKFTIFKFIHRNSLSAYSYFGLDDLSLATETLTVKL